MYLLPPALLPKKVHSRPVPGILPLPTKRKTKMRGHYKITVPPTTEPLTLAEAKAHLRVEFDDDDTLIEALVSAARSAAEEYTNRAIMPQTVQHVLPWFPCADGRNEFGAVRLFRSPFASLTSVDYWDADNAAQEIDVNDLIVVGTAEPALVCPAVDTEWPETANRPDAVTITYQAGYANAAAVPKPVKQSVLLMVATWYERREDQVQQLPRASEALLQPYIVREY